MTKALIAIGHNSDHADPAEMLAELADAINRDWEVTKATAFGCWHATGQRLTEARKLAGPGFRDWLQGRFSFDLRRAQQLIKFAADFESAPVEVQASTREAESWQAAQRVLSGKATSPSTASQ